MHYDDGATASFTVTNDNPPKTQATLAEGVTSWRQSSASVLFYRFSGKVDSVQVDGAEICNAEVESVTICNRRPC